MRRLANIPAPAGLLLLVFALSCDRKTTPTGPGPDLSPAKIEFVTPAGLEAPGGTVVPEIVARVLNSRGERLNRQRVVWTVTRGGGFVDPETTWTDVNGDARTAWRLGYEIMTQTVTARAAVLEPVPLSVRSVAWVSALNVTAPDTMWVGDSAQVIVTAEHVNGGAPDSLPLRYTSTNMAVAQVLPGGRIRATGIGQTVIGISGGGLYVEHTLRVRDEPVSLALTAPSTLIDISQSLTLSATLTGRTGNSLPTTDVQWTCLNAAAVDECGRTLVPRFAAMDDTVEVTVIATSGAFADSVAIRVYEKSPIGMWVSFPPSPIGPTANGMPVPLVLTVGDTLPLFVRVIFDDLSLPAGIATDRPYRLSVVNGTIASLTLGEVLYGADRVVRLAARDTGTTRVVVRVGTTIRPLDVVVRSRTLASCPADRTLSLDLPLGEPRFFRPGDAFPQCLDFRAARDADRVYLVLSDPLPRTSGKWSNSPGLCFDCEGQGLFYVSGGQVPASYPTVRVFPRDGTPAAPQLPDASPAPTDQRRWLFQGAELREAPLVRLPLANAPRAQVTPPRAVQVGDTLDGMWWPYQDQRMQTTDGGAIDMRAVVVYVSPWTVLAEWVDVLRGRLVIPGGSAIRRIPPDQFAVLDSAMSIPRRQLDRLFGPALSATMFGYDFGPRALLVNTHLMPGIWGAASDSYVWVHYWSGITGTTPPNAVPIADQLLVHELAHLRHLSKYPLQGPTHIWVVEGIANFSEHLAGTSRLFGTGSPSRTGRRSFQRGEAMGGSPWLPASYLESLFEGYERSSYVFDYIADHVESAGGNGLGAVLDLVKAGHDAGAADAAVQQHLGMSFTTAAARARMAAMLEQTRATACESCIRPAEMPDWSRYLQYDMPSILFGSSDSEIWPVLRPGTTKATSFILRTGSMWPVFLDGRGATADQEWVLDLERAPQTSIGIVRIR